MSEFSERPLIIECQRDRMVGILHLPQGQPQDTAVLIIVGGPQYRVGSHRQFTLMARDLSKAGYPVLRFDYRGMGDSDGDARPFDSVDDDIRAAIDTILRETPHVVRVVLWGLCDAASAAMIYCNCNDKRVGGLILANPWVRTLAGEANAYLKHYYLKRLFQKSFWKKALGGAFDLRRSLRDLFGAVKQAQRAERSDSGGFIGRMLGGLRLYSGPMLLLISERDLTAKEFTDHVNAHADWKRCIETASVRQQLLPGADHTFSGPGELQAATGHCLDWLRGIESRSA